jgi:hypothetical protein
MRFWAYVNINYFYYLHMSNSFMKLCQVFLKHPVCACKYGVTMHFKAF